MSLGILYVELRIGLLCGKRLLILYEDNSLNSPCRYVYLAGCRCQEKSSIYSQYFPKIARSKLIFVTLPTSPLVTESPPSLHLLTVLLMAPEGITSSLERAPVTQLRWQILHKAV